MTTAKRPTPRKITARSLENAATFYLQRFAASTWALRRFLERRVERAAAHHPETDREQAAAWIETVLSKFTHLGYLDDARFAASKARTLLERGKSPTAIRAALKAKGVSEEVIAEALDGLAAVSPDTPERTAAHTLARRRRLGPYGPAEGREERRARDLAVLGRAGFSYDVALQVIDGDREAR